MLVELVELRAPLLLRFCISRKQCEQSRCERGVNPFEELEEDQADGVAFWQRPIAAGAWDFFYQLRYTPSVMSRRSFLRRPANMRLAKQGLCQSGSSSMALVSIIMSRPFAE